MAEFTKTGRLSNKGPNMQNIPIRTKEGAAIKAAFTGEPSVNCPTCGRFVPSIFEHVDVECQDWPDRDEPLPHTYRGYEVDHNSILGFWYQYVHEDYDGPEDNRAGTENTLDAVYRAIDDQEDE